MRKRRVMMELKHENKQGNCKKSRNQDQLNQAQIRPRKNGVCRKGETNDRVAN